MGTTLTGVLASAAASAAGASTVASVSVTDSAADVQGFLDSLESVSASGKLGTITLTDSGTPILTITATQYQADAAALAAITTPYNLIVDAVPASAAALAPGISNVLFIGVTDLAANIQANLDSLQTVAIDGKLGTVTLLDSGTPTITITQAQLANDGDALGQIAGSFVLDVTGVAAADAASVLGQASVAAVAVSDSAANVQNNISALESLAAAGELTSIVLTDGGTPTISLTAAQDSADTLVLSKINSAYSIDIVPPQPSGTLPDIDKSFTKATAKRINAEVKKLLGTGTPNVVTVTATGAGTTYANDTIPNALNALVFAPTGQRNAVTLPNGYQIGYVTTADQQLQDNGVGNALLIGAAANVTLLGAFNDTLYGGNGNATLSGGNGNETLSAGTGTNVIGAGSGNDVITSSGESTIVGGSTGTDTITTEGKSALVSGNGAPLDVIGAGAALTVEGGSGGNTVSGGSGAQLIYGTSELDYTGGTGAATIVGGSAGNTVTGGAGSLLVFAENSLTFTGGSGAATVVGGSVPVSATLAGGGGTLFGSPGGSNNLAATGGNASLVGGSGGDTLTAGGPGNDLLVAGSGSESLNGSAATGNLTMYGGNGFDTLTGGAGSDVFIAGSGNETLTGGAGNNQYLFFATPGTSRVETITDFDPNRNQIGLFGYAANAAAAALASVSTLGGGTSVTLGDGTKILFTGSVSLHSYNFY